MSSVISRPWLLFLVCLVGLMIVVEIGIRLRLASASLDEKHQPPVQSAREGLTVLLSFLLGFALPMTLPYYEARRDLLIDEENAISTIDHRAELLPAPYGERIREVLPQYVDARLDFGQQEDDEAVRTAATQAVRLQNTMWREVVSLVQARPDAVNGSIVILISTALDNLSDLGEKRLAAYERRIPGTIWLVLLAIAVLTCFVVGYSMRQRQFLSAFVLPLTVAIVFSLVSELENSQTGFIRYEQEGMQRLRAELRAELGH